MRVIAKLLWVTCFVACVAGKRLPLPSYITPCSKNEPDLNACATKSGRAAIPKFIDGDRKYKIPVLDPLEISELRVDEGVLGLNFSASQVKLYGLRQANLTKVIWNVEGKRGEYRVFIPRLEVDAQYEIDGRILILPITGKGYANLTFIDVTVNYTFDYVLEKRPDGYEYLLPKQGHLSFDTSRMFVYLANLFNGNKLLGDQTNNFMNENWREMLKQLGPVLGDTVGEIMRRIQYNIFELVDYNEAFPDTLPSISPRP